MARRVRAKTITIVAPTTRETQRLWREIVGDGAALIEADRIRLEVKPAAKAKNRKPKAKGRQRTRKTP